MVYSPTFGCFSMVNVGNIPYMDPMGYNFSPPSCFTVRDPQRIGISWNHHWGRGDFPPNYIYICYIVIKREGFWGKHI